MPSGEPVIILLVEDDEDDYLLTRDALAESRILNDLRWVRDGEEALDYLKQRGEYREEGSAPRPMLILLDLNMPRKDGREVLQEIKSDPQLRAIPVVVLTTSSTDEDVLRSYRLGVNSFIQKPVDFVQFNTVVRKVTEYWFQLVKLPT